MRLAFVTPYYYPEVQFGGPPKRLHALAKLLVARGHTLSVVTFDSKARGRDDRVNIDGVAVQYLPWFNLGAGQVPVGFTLARQALAGVELIHGYGLYNFICPLAAKISLKRGIPFVLEPMGMFVPRARSLLKKRLYNVTLTRWMARSAARVISTSQLEKDELLSLVSANRIVVRQNGIDLDEFATLPDAQPLRTRLGMKPGDRLISYIGRISSKKNLHDLVDAFVRAALPGLKLLIAGPVSEPQYAQILRDKIDRSQRKQDIWLEDAVYGEDLKAVLSATDLFVLPSLNENFGNAAGEAVAAGVPVLLTETCGIAPLIHERAGLAVALGVENLATGLRIMLDPAARDQFLVKREEVKRDLSWDEPVTQTERLYEEIISGRNKLRTESVPDRVEETR